MTQSDYSTPRTAPQSAVTKHIKIYSDNPIHDAIDRIIDACLSIDEGIDDYHLESLELKEAAQDLFILAWNRLNQIQCKYDKQANEQKPN